MDPFAGNYSDPQSLHKYLYTHANPVMGIDPSGEYNLILVLTVVAIVAVLLYLLLPTGRTLIAQSASTPTTAQQTVIQNAGNQIPLLLGPYNGRYKNLKDFWRDDVDPNGQYRTRSFEVSSQSGFYGMVPSLSGHRKIIFGVDFFTSTANQQTLALIHEMRHSYDQATEPEAYRTTWFAELLYRRNANPGLRSLPIPPNEPAHVVFREQYWNDIETNYGYITLADRQRMTREFNLGTLNKDELFP